MGFLREKENFIFLENIPMTTIWISNDKKIFKTTRSLKKTDNILDCNCENLFCTNKVIGIFQVESRRDMFIGWYCQDCIDYFTDRIQSWGNWLFNELMSEHISKVLWKPSTTIASYGETIIDVTSRNSWRYEVQPTRDYPITEQYGS